MEARKWLQGAVWENREAFEAGNHQGVSWAQPLLGAAAEGGPWKEFTVFPGKPCSVCVIHGHAGTKDMDKGTMDPPEPT